MEPLLKLLKPSDTDPFSRQLPPAVIVAYGLLSVVTVFFLSFWWLAWLLIVALVSCGIFKFCLIIFAEREEGFPPLLPSQTINLWSWSQRTSLLTKNICDDDSYLWDQNESQPQIQTEGWKRPQQQPSSSFVCLICGDVSCQRHDRLIHGLHLNPWKGLLVNKEVDSALEEIFDYTIRDYIIDWFKDIKNHNKTSRQPDDEDKFIQEIKSIIRFLVASLVRIVHGTVDTNRLIVNDLLKTIMCHIQLWMAGKRRARSALFIEQSVLEEYHEQGTLHPCLLSRAEEVKWLRKLVDLTLPYLLSPKYLTNNGAKAFVRELLCSAILLPTFDLICDPHKINTLIVAVFGEEADSLHLTFGKQKNSEEMVEILSHFIERTSIASKESSRVLLGIPLKQVLDDQQLLFLFMSYLKGEGSVNLIQFMLTVDGFNHKIMSSPDLSESVLKELKEEAMSLYTSYFAPTGCDFIAFNSDIVNEMKSIVESKDVAEVEKLRRTRTLFDATDQVYRCLENYYLPLFFESDLYLKLVCGSRLTSLDSFDTGNEIYMIRKGSQKNRERNALAKRPSLSPDDPLIDNNNSVEEGDNDENDDELSEEEEEEEEELGIDLIEALTAACSQPAAGQANNLKDLSSWRVCIPTIETRMDVSNTKYYHVFSIHVQRIDVPIERNQKAKEQEMGHSPDDVDMDLMDSWTVERKYGEFYVLENKLKEFHGDLVSACSVASLPAKRQLFNKQSKQFLESKREPFEAFLQSLLSSSSLKGSQLVHNFLSLNKEMFAGTLMPDINLKKMMRTVPAKLTQERGQNLDSFLVSFVNSTLASSSLSKEHVLEQVFSEEKPIDSHFNQFFVSHPIFGDNYGQNQEVESVASEPCLTLSSSSSPPSASSSDHSSIYDFLYFIVTRLLSSSSSYLLNLLLLFETMFKSTVQSLAEMVVESRLRSLVFSNPSLLVSLLHILRDDLFIDKQSKVTTSREKKEKSRLALQSLKHLFCSSSSASFALLSLEDQEQISFLIFSLLQHPLLNKQLLYLSLNDLIKQLFPQIVVKSQEG